MPARDRTAEPRRGGWRASRALGASMAVLVLSALALAAMGRVVWCGCGSPRPGSWDVASRHNSQHLLDPYTLSHLLHGLLFYGLGSLVLRGRPLGLRLVAALVLEAGWEILENTDAMIERYRAATISLRYYGDSVVNSLGDIAACAVGFFVAASVPARVAVALFVVVEVAMLLWIRDNLMLNVLMLLWPIEAVRSWQSGA